MEHTERWRFGGVSILTFSPGAPEGPGGPIGPVIPRMPSLPAAPSAPLTPPSPWQERGTHQSAYQSGSLTAQEPLMTAFLPSGFFPVLTLSPLRPGRPPAPRSPGMPWRPGGPTPPAAPAAPASPWTSTGQRENDPLHTRSKNKPITRKRCQIAKCSDMTSPNWPL